VAMGGLYSGFLERMEPLLGATLDGLAGTSFRIDPLGGQKYSRATSIISSAYKRHGQLLGRALLERLKDCSQYVVWTEQELKLSFSTIAELSRGLQPEAYREISCPYGDEERSIPVDVITFNPSKGLIRSYNVKRGNGSYDAGKKRQLVNELLRTQMLLAGYGNSLGYRVVNAEAYVLFYYGVISAPRSYALVRENLDEHFMFPVVAALEAMNDEFSARLHKLIEQGVKT
jgi:hypothetical protein